MSKDGMAAQGPLDRGVSRRPLFLWRTVFDENTQTYCFADGSGRVPEEMRQDMLNACEMRSPLGGNGLFVLGTLFAWKDRLETANAIGEGPGAASCARSLSTDGLCSTDEADK